MEVKKKAKKSEPDSKFLPVGKRAACTKEKILEVLADNKGLIYNSLKQTGLSSSTFYKWMDEDPEFKKAVEATEIIEINYVRSKLAQLIDENNPQAIMFFCKAKNGFVETKKIDATVNANDVIDVNLALSKIKDEINKE